MGVVRWARARVPERAFGGARAGVRPAPSRARRSARLLAMALPLAAAGVVGCGSGGDAGERGTSASSRPALTVGYNAGPQSLDPARDGNQIQVMRALSNESITHLKADGTVGPGLTTSFGYVGSGNRDFEFTLRADARFSDGTPVTAQAVKQWLLYFARANGPLVSTLGEVRSIDAIGRSRVRIHLAAANPNVPVALSEAFNWGAVSSPKALANPRELGTQTFGAGPYVLVASQTVSGDHYTFVPNRHYYDQSAIRFSRVVFKIIATPSSMLSALKTGQVDVAIGDSATADSATAAGLELVSEPVNTDGFALMDKSGKLSKPLGDVRVRQAMNYAIDRETVAKALMGAHATPTSEWITTDGWDPASQDYYDYDPAKARSLLRAAGYPNGFSLRVVDQGSYVGNLGDPMVQAVAKYLAEVGIKLDVTATSSQAEFNQKVLSGTFPATQIFTGFPTVSFYGLYLKSGSPLNPSSYTDPVVDRLFGESLTASDPQSVWREMSRRLVTEAAFVPVFNYDTIWYVTKAVGGIAFSASRPFPVPTEWEPKE